MFQVPQISCKDCGCRTLENLHPKNTAMQLASASRIIVYKVSDCNSFMHKSLPSWECCQLCHLFIQSGSASFSSVSISISSSLGLSLPPLACLYLLLSVFLYLCLSLLLCSPKIIVVLSNSFHRVCPSICTYVSTFLSQFCALKNAYYTRHFKSQFMISLLCHRPMDDDQACPLLPRQASQETDHNKQSVQNGTVRQYSELIMWMK